MKLVLALNAVSSQVWAVILILLGIGTFWLACHCSEHDARTELMSTERAWWAAASPCFSTRAKSRNRQNPKSSKSFKSGVETMSIFSSIENAAHSFAAWVEKEWKKLYNEAPKLEQVADTVLAYVGPALQTVVTLEAGGPAGAIVGSVIQEAQKDLTAASGLIYDFGATPSIEIGRAHV